MSASWDEFIKFWSWVGPSSNDTKLQQRYRDPTKIKTYSDEDDYKLTKKVIPGFGISMLDIIACGLGGVSLVAVLYMIIKIPLPPPLSDNFIMAEIEFKGQGLVGFAIKHNDGAWYHIYQPELDLNNYLDDRTLLVGSNALATDVTYSTGYHRCDIPEEQELGACTVTRIHLYIDKPAIGDWTIQPYYSFNRKQASTYQTGELTDAQCFYWTRLDAYLNTKELCPEDIDLESTGKRLQEIKLNISS